MNSEDPDDDQMPHSAEFDLGLLCLSRFLLGGTRYPKNPENSDIRKICCNHLKTEQRVFTI